ncbi:hypothetical protein NT01EI_3874 [Edwardsiella ictaluri 93-146]|uniref:Uncharacterized protein n=1 Tax=Edwardsiella ictaluri (strain 93-146) TaxID=634503 RepID=C5BC86_EDWI9|nr:hypothetical protein NT01EI_3874 [Edwardsiella ictaluri 93-146]
MTLIELSGSVGYIFQVIHSSLLMFFILTPSVLSEYDIDFK